MVLKSWTQASPLPLILPWLPTPLISKVDCITNLTDNTVVASLPVILIRLPPRISLYSAAKFEQVKIGCLAAMGLDYIELGKQTGKMAAQVLRGEKKASEMNYETIKGSCLLRQHTGGRESGHHTAGGFD